ncbi:MAG: hypothetical protein RBS77_00315 [Candidatus Moranbacteria bacterium]|jgi:hypothetical protein|nr:hypothetical protein [Candidatus Moranbacteria bacterium]
MSTKKNAATSRKVIANMEEQLKSLRVAIGNEGVYSLLEKAVIKGDAFAINRLKSKGYDYLGTMDGLDFLKSKFPCPAKE